MLIQIVLCIYHLCLSYYLYSYYSVVLLSDLLNIYKSIIRIYAWCVSYYS